LFNQTNVFLLIYVKICENSFKFKHFPVRFTQKHLWKAKKMLENQTNTLIMIKEHKAVQQKVDNVAHDLTKDGILVVSPSLGAYKVPNED